ncbi:MAG: lysylphosphatidylglycerol synthase domain-containing protein [Rhodospirillaceae bacterium]|nr:lysylphosphatidylglycerol synthase domain-containing protein [Rhodospirillaceae bacterium]
MARVPESPAPSGPARAWVWFALKAVIGGGLLAFMLSRVSLGDSLAALSGVSAAAWVLALVLAVIAHAVNAAKLCGFIPGFAFWPSLRFTFIGTLYGTVLPSPLAGDAVKAVRMARAGDDPGPIVAAVIRDKVMGLAALIALSLAAVPVAGLPGRGETAALFIAGLAAAALLWLVLDRAPRHGLLAPLMRHLPPAAAAGLGRGQLARNFVWGLVFQALVVAIFAILGHDVGITISVADWTVVVGLVSVILLLPVTVAGLGLREGSLVGLLGALGQSGEAALALSFAVLILSLATAGVGLIFDLAGRDRIGARA